MNRLLIRWIFMGSSYNVHVFVSEVLELSGSLPTHQPDLEPQLFVQ